MKFDDFIRNYAWPLTVAWYIFMLSALGCLGAGVAAALYEPKSSYIFGLLVYGSLSTMIVLMVYFLEMVAWCIEPKPLLPLTSL